MHTGKCWHFPAWMSLPAERQADSAAPEIETAQRQIEIVVRFVVLQRPEVAHIAADADVVVELSVDAGADIHAEIVGRQIVEQTVRFDLRTDQAQTRRQVRTQTRSWRRADQQVGHERRDVAVTELEVGVARRVLEKVWRPSEVNLETNDVGIPSHCRTEIETPLDFVICVGEITEICRAAEVGADKW